MENFSDFMRFYKISEFCGYQIRISRQKLTLEKCLFERNKEKNFCAKKYRPRQNSNPRPLSLTPPALPLGHPLILLNDNIFVLYPDDQNFRFFPFLFRIMCSTVRGGVKIVKFFKSKPYMSYRSAIKFFKSGLRLWVMSLVSLFKTKV